MFSMLWHPKTLQNLAMYNVFFIFGRFSIAGKLPKWPKIPFQYPSCAQTPKNLRKMSKTPPNSGLGAKPFLPPPKMYKRLILRIFLNSYYSSITTQKLFKKNHNNQPQLPHSFLKIITTYHQSPHSFHKIITTYHIIISFIPHKS